MLKDCESQQTIETYGSWYLRFQHRSCSSVHFFTGFVQLASSIMRGGPCGGVGAVERRGVGERRGPRGVEGGVRLHQAGRGGQQAEEGQRVKAVQQMI